MVNRGVLIIILLLWGFAFSAVAGDINIRDVALKADNITIDYEGRNIEGEGNILLESEEYRLNSDKISYNEKTGAIVATGNVVLVNKKDKSTLKSDHAVLDGAFHSVTLQRMQLLFQNRGTINADSGTRRNGTDHQLKNADFTPCKVCQGESPMWSVAADTVEHDTISKKIHYYNAYFRIYDVPVFYLPYFEQDDPTVKRSSGFLRSSVAQRSEEGIMARIPYYHTIAPNQDITATPVISQNGGNVLAMEHRYLGHNYGITSVGSLGNVNKVKDSKLQDETNVSGHIDSTMNWQPDDFWNVYGDVERASRKGYLKQFDFDERDILSSGGSAVYIKNRDTFTVDSRTYQDLRAAENSDDVPVVLPDTRFSHLWQSPDWMQGALSSTVSGRALQRTNSIDNQRVSTINSWQRDFIIDDGSIIGMKGLLRQDMYHRNVSDSDITNNNENDTKGRFVPALQVAYKKPFYKAGDSGIHQISPTAQVVAMPNNLNSSRIDNEDSQAFELDADNLFSINRPTGYDITSEGSRADYGASYAYQGDVYLADVFLGQSIQLDNPKNQELLAGGVKDNFTDPVAKWQVSFPDIVSMDHSIRLKQNDASIARSVFNITTNAGGFTTSLNHFLLDRGSGTADAAKKREEVSGTIGIPFTEQWSWNNTAIRDLQSDENRLAQTQLVYKIDCATFSLEYRKDYTNDPNATAGNSIMFRIDLTGVP